MRRPQKHTNPSVSGPQSGGQSNNKRLGSLRDGSKKGEIGTVLHYYTDTYRAVVKSDAGATPFTAQRLRASPGDIAPLPKGTEVLITREYGAPLILGIVSNSVKEDTTDTQHTVTSLTGIGGEAEYKDPNPQDGNFRRPADPTDILPGDHVQMSDQGNLIAVLKAGMNVMKSSAVAQIQTLQTDDLVRIISRNYQHLTDMGIFEIKNTDGRISLQFRGGTDQQSEAGPDEEKWSIRMDIAEHGDSFNFEVTTPQGNTLFKLGVDADGRCEIFGINGLSLNSGNQNGGGHQEEHTGNSIANFRGNRTTNITGSETHNTSGNRSERARGDYELSGSNDLRFNAMRDIAFGAGRNFGVAVTGDLLNPLNDAVNYKIMSGNYHVDLVNPAVPTNSFKVTTAAGNFEFNSALAGNFEVFTPAGVSETTARQFNVVTGLPDSVVLGGAALVSHVAKFEELQAYVSALHRSLDLHTHLISGTAQAGPFTVAGLTGLPTVPIGAPLDSMVPFIRSMLVGVGG